MCTCHVLQGRSFELGVFRQHGTTRKQLLILLLHSALVFSLPSVLLGVPLAHYVLQLVALPMLNEISGNYPLRCLTQ